MPPTKSTRRRRDRRRRGARQRGYGVKWQRFAKRFAARWVELGKPCGLCGRRFTRRSRIDVDHIVPVVEDPARLFDETNLRAVHHHCHSRRTAQDKAAAERGYTLGVGEDGLPLDPGHPFYSR